MRWAAILAGGNGRRLQPLTRLWTGDDRPKQFCALLNGETLLAHTRRRIAQNVLPCRTVCVVTREHRPYYQAELADVSPARMIEQPGDLGTAAAIAYAMTRIGRQDRKAVIGVFPTDHHYEHEARFSEAVDATYHAAARHPALVFLLAAEPTSPEADYGWIEPGLPIDTASRDTFAVKRFLEKPSRDVAAELMARGALWNTFVMIGSLNAFRALTHAAVPAMARAFELLDTSRPAEAKAVARLYASHQPADFSRDVLVRRPDHAAVVRLADVGWMDLGRPARVLRLLTEHQLAELSLR